MMKRFLRTTAITTISFLLLPYNIAHATNGGFGSTSDTIPFFVSSPSGETYVGTWTANALNVTGGLNATGNAVVTGSMTALYYDHTSDARLKTDIHPVDNALDRLLSIRGVEFKWKKDGRSDMGVVAQDVAKSFPIVVHTNKAGVKSVEYDSLVAPLIEAVRELKNENDGLSAEVSAVKAEIDAAKGK
jgi:hypothetical protein